MRRMGSHHIHTRYEKTYSPGSQYFVFSLSSNLHALVSAARNAVSVCGGESGHSMFGYSIEGAYDGGDGREYHHSI